MKKLVLVCLCLLPLFYLVAPSETEARDRSRVIVRNGGGIFNRSNVRIINRRFNTRTSVNTITVPQQVLLLNEFANFAAVSSFVPSVEVRTSFPVQAFSIVQPSVSISSSTAFSNLFGGSSISIRSNGRCGF